MSGILRLRMTKEKLIEEGEFITCPHCELPIVKKSLIEQKTKEKMHKRRVGDINKIRLMTDNIEEIKNVLNDGGYTDTEKVIKLLELIEEQKHGVR